MKGALSLHRFARQRRGEYSEHPESSFNRIVLVKRDGIDIIDPERTHTRTSVLGHTDVAGPFPADAADRKTVSAQVGQTLFLASAVGITPEDPEPVLAIHDDYVIPLVLPDVPRIDISYEGVVTPGLPNVDYTLLSPGIYAFRFQWVMADGSFGPATGPYIKRIPNGPSVTNELYKVNFEVVSASVPDYWRHLLRGIAVGCTKAPAPIVDPDESGEVATEGEQHAILNVPFFRICEIPTNEGKKGWVENLSEWKTSWSDASDNIAGYPQFEDDALVIGKAGTVFSYNRRLVLGDVAIDFAKPRADVLFADVLDVPATPPVIEEIGPQEGAAGVTTDDLYIEINNDPGVTFSDIDILVTSAADTYLVIHEIWSGSQWVEDKTIIDQGDGVEAGTAPFTKTSSRRRIKFEFTETVGVTINITITAINIFGLSDNYSFPLVIT